MCNSVGLEARNIVRTYESKAIGGPEDLLFKSQSGKVLESARIRDLLKSAVQKGCSQKCHFVKNEWYHVL